MKPQPKIINIASELTNVLDKMDKKTRIKKLRGLKKFVKEHLEFCGDYPDENQVKIAVAWIRRAMEYRMKRHEVP